MEVRSSKSCAHTSARALSATLPKEMTRRGFTMSIVLRRNGEQFRISVRVGELLLPSRSRGLQRTAFVMKTSHRCHCMARKSSSKRSPVRSPKRGIPVLSAPRRPGASATNRTLASHRPFNSLSTLRDADMREHRRQFCASRTSSSVGSRHVGDRGKNSLASRR